MTKHFSTSLIILALVFTCFSFISMAQNTPSRTESGSSPVTLDAQYRDMLMRSRNQEGYKLVNPNRLTNLWKNTMDTLRFERKKRLAAEQNLSSRMTTLEAMKDSLAENQATLDKSRTMIDQISFLGIPVSKSTYNLIMWGAVLILALALFIVLFQATGHKREAHYRVKLYEELSEEFQSHKVKANEREKKLARELQDERNKLDELGHRGL